MSPSAAVYLAAIGALCDVAALVTILWWNSGRKRAASEIIERADRHAADVRQQAGREAESLKKEAQLEAREKTHALVADAEAKARARQHEIAGLEQGLAEKTRAVADRIASTDAIEKGLRARDAAVAAAEKHLAAAAVKSDQILADRQRELQRVAGLTSEEARELLLKIGRAHV